MAAKIVEGRRVHPRVSFDVNPTSRQILENLARDGHLASLIHAGARLHQAGCNGCIGMGQAPATDRISLRTVPRNFPGRSGTKEDKVCLVSPETAAASALMGVITDPRTLDMDYPIVSDPEAPVLNVGVIARPPPPEEARTVALVKGPNITSIPALEPLHDEPIVPVLLKLGDDISTDEILPAGVRVLPFRSNLRAISRFCFEGSDPTYAERAKALSGGERGSEHAIVAGRNYGQGSSREHAALAPAYLGLRVVLALSFARIHMQNLANFGVLPLVLEDRADYERAHQGDRLRLCDLRRSLMQGVAPIVENTTTGERLRVHHELSSRQNRDDPRGGPPRLDARKGRAAATLGLGGAAAPRMTHPRTASHRYAANRVEIFVLRFVERRSPKPPQTAGVLARTTGIRSSSRRTHGPPHHNRRRRLHHASW